MRNKESDVKMKKGNSQTENNLTSSTSKKHHWEEKRINIYTRTTFRKIYSECGERYVRDK